MSFLSSLRGSEISETTDSWEEFLAEKKRKFQEKLCLEAEMIVSLSDFEIRKTLGSGSFGTVVLAKRLASEQYYAIKILARQRLVKMKVVKQTLNEKRILWAVDFPFIIHMEFFFKDNSYIYFVLPFMSGGELFSYLRTEKKFSENVAIFYAAQIVLGFEYLHYLDVVYRDLKPENVLIDKTGYIKIADLGFAKIVKTRTYTLCGTPDYLAPEVILSKGYSHAVDWWALGVLVYEMVAGVPPFYASDPMITYKRISSAQYILKPSFSPALKDLLFNLIQVDVTKRYGSLMDGAKDIKNHGWFRSLRWTDVLSQSLKPPYVPKVKSPGDARNFEACTHKELRIASVERFKEAFKDF